MSGVLKAWYICTSNVNRFNGHSNTTNELLQPKLTGTGENI